MKNLKRFGSPALYLSTLLYMGYVDVRNWGISHFNNLADFRGNKNDHASLEERRQLAEELQKDEGRTVLIEFLILKDEITRKGGFTGKFGVMRREWPSYTIILHTQRPTPHDVPLQLNPYSFVNEYLGDLLSSEDPQLNWWEATCNKPPVPLENCLASIHSYYRVYPRLYVLKDQAIIPWRPPRQINPLIGHLLIPGFI